MDNAKKIIKNMTYCSSVEEVFNESNAVIIGTEWNDFRALNLNHLKKGMKEAILFDLRNIYNKEELIAFSTGS